MKPRLLTAIIALLLSPLAALAAEEWVPYDIQPGQTDVRVWSSLGVTYARVQVTFNHGGYRVVDWGQPVRSGNNISVNLVAERWTGASTQAVIFLENSYTLGQLTPGNYTFTVRSRGATVKSASFDPAQAGQGWGPATVAADRVFFNAFTSFGESTGRLNIKLPDFGYEVADWGQPVRDGNDFTFDLKVDRFTGAPSPARNTYVFHDYALGQLPNGTYTATIKTRGETVKVETFHVGPVTQPANPIDRPEFFTRQQYLDFLNREPDAPGLGFWQGQILECGGAAACAEAKRIHVSAAFFLAIEHHETGFLVHRLYKAALGRAPSFAEFLPDARAVGRDVTVGAAGWQQQLEANKTAFIDAFVARPEFAARFPETLTPEQFVEALNANTKEAASPAGAESASLSTAECYALAAGLKSGAETRASVLRKVAESAEFTRRQVGPAFVRMQYFGYLRRDPDEAGFRFWLTKLSNHNNDYAAAEMVKAFLDSSEYRGRFVAQPSAPPAQ